jgi:cytochrome oxidase Cu insertion factor (SCO1/SenC/PrrC family)
MNKTALGFGIILIVIGSLVLTNSMRRETFSTVTLDYGTVPEFSLTERSGRTVTLKNLIGKVWIADFIFTSCAGTCPTMTAQMRSLQNTLPVDIGLVSFTVDPSRDTPAVLTRYAQQMGADSERWLFLTGDRQTLSDLTIKGFKLALNDTEGSETEPITHSSRFVLIDRKGHIHAYYSSSDPEDMKRLIEDARELL